MAHHNVPLQPHSPRNWAQPTGTHNHAKCRSFDAAVITLSLPSSNILSPNAKARGELAPSFPLPASMVHGRRLSIFDALEKERGFCELAARGGV